MKAEMKKSVKIAALFVGAGLLISLFVFFLFFGKGLQILMPCISVVVFFGLFLLFEKIPFLVKRPLLKAVFFVVAVIIAIVLI